MSIIHQPALPGLDLERRAVTPLELVRVALDQNASIETLERLMNLQERYEANEARKAYNASFNAFKANSIRIVRNIDVKDGPLKGKKYADLFAVVDAVTSGLSAHELNSSWKLTKDEPGWIEVTCTIRHALGHSESVAMGGPPDTGGAKNAIQARASTISYLERYTLLAATGLAATGQDDDGNKGAQMPEQQYITHMDNIQNAGQAELKRLYEAAYKAAEAAGDKEAMKKFIETKDKRKRELSQ